MGTEESQECDFSGGVQGLGLISWVNTRTLLVRLAPSERSADFLASTFKDCNNLVQISKAGFFAMDGIKNTHMTSQIHLAQKWPSKYFPDRLENLKSVHQKLVAQQ